MASVTLARGLSFAAAARRGAMQFRPAATRVQAAALSRTAGKCEGIDFCKCES